MGDFEIDEKLIKFNDEVPPAIGSMRASANEIIDKNNKVSETSDACGSSLGGAYKTNNTDKAKQAYTELAEGCKTIANEVQSKMMQILDECSELGELIEELKKIKKEAEQVMARIAQLQSIIASKRSQDPPLDTSAEEAELAQKRQRLEELKEDFKSKHEDAKSKLASLQGKDASISDMKPTNGSLGFDPSISVSVVQGTSKKDTYYNYSTGDQTVQTVQEP